MGHARRRLLHRRAFEVLEEGGAPAAQLARHALAGGLAEQAFRYGVAAGDAAVEVFSVKDAIEHYERARDLLTEVRTGSRQLTSRRSRTWSTCTFSWAEPTSCQRSGTRPGRPTRRCLL